MKILPKVAIVLMVLLLGTVNLFAQAPDTLWTRTYGGAGGDEGRSVQQTSDDGYIIVGGTESFGAGGKDIYLIKTDSLGDTLWTRTYGGTDWDAGGSVQQTSDGGYIIAGQTASFGAGVSDVYLIKTDASGDSLWAKIYGGTSSAEIGFSVQQTSDSGYIVAGVTTSGPGTTYGYLIKTESLGDSLWAKTYGEGGDYDWLVSVQQTSDGGYIIAGLADSFGAGGLDVWVIRTDANGDTLWMKSYGGTADDVGYSVQQTSDGGYIVVGGTGSYGAGKGDVWLIKIAPESGIEEEDTPNLFYISQSEPNPFYNITRVKYELPKSCNVHIEVYNILGARIKTLLNEKKNAGTHTITWDGKDNNGGKLPSGFYFLRLDTGEYEGTRKLLLIK